MPLLAGSDSFNEKCGVFGVIGTDSSKDVYKRQPYGVPGLETTLPMMMSSVIEGRISENALIKKLHTSPARIFDIPTDESSNVTLIMDDSSIGDQQFFTKAGWSPFEGYQAGVRVSRVELRGKCVYEDGKVLAKPGSGQVIS